MEELLMTENCPKFKCFEIAIASFLERKEKRNPPIVLPV